jgi:HCOMODA/2-hydroxy-3-carboxy-muconic semialdehyde decarboxylase
MSFDRAVKDLVIANRILANEGVLDSFGHVSVRHPTEPDRYLLSRSCSPGIVTADDIVEFTLDGRPVREESRTLYIERHLHGGVYEVHPDVQAILHAHTDELLPFAVTDIPLRPIIQSVGDMGAQVPVWDIADRFGDDTDLLISNMEQGRDLARSLMPNKVLLLRGHGFVSVDRSLMALVRLAVFLPRNARVLLQAMSLGRQVRGLSEGEIAARLRLDPAGPALRRGWDYWARQAECGDLL